MPTPLSSQPTWRLSCAALRVLHALEQAGYPAYLVGGSLRDALRGVPPHDYDITTPATPTQMQEVFSRANLRTMETGLQHGTLTVLVEGEPIECTTYRVESLYSDGRHPDAVRFTDRIADDLCRRDFTVNAMACRLPAAARDDFDCDHPRTVALGRDVELVDLYGGRRDLDARVLRCVGDPCVRFEEDSLRILRCVRFSVQLGCSVEDETARALYQCRQGLSRVSRERCTAELVRMLESPMPLLRGLLLAETSALWPYLLPDCVPPSAADMARTALLPARLPLRLAQLLRATLVQKGMAAVQTCCHTLRLSNALCRQIRLCLLGAQEPNLCDDAALRRLMAATMEQTSDTLLLCGACRLTDEEVLALPDDIPGDGAALAARLPDDVRRALHRCEELRTRGDCLTASQLALDGHALAACGLRGAQIGRAQALLLARVLDDPTLNTPDSLGEIVRLACETGAL